jgi:hypothetical protein
MSPQPKSSEFSIHIDRNAFKVSQSHMTGTELRQLPTPPVTHDFDLYLQTHGQEDDLLVGDADSIEMKNGLHFFTAPATIAPGLAT